MNFEARAKFFRKLFALKSTILSFMGAECICCGADAFGGNGLCEKCRADFIKPVEIAVPEESPYIRAVSAGSYSGAGKEAVLKYKFGERYRFISSDLLSALITAFDEKYSGMKFDFVVPVPYFREDDDEKNKEGIRLRFLGKNFARLAGIRFGGGLLKKNRRTKKQHDLSEAERRTNLLGAFEASPEVKGKRILLLDDILTTGSTALACSKELMAEHASEVCVLTVLKT